MILLRMPERLCTQPWAGRFPFSLVNGGNSWKTADKAALAQGSSQRGPVTGMLGLETKNHWALLVHQAQQSQKGR